MVVEPLLLLRFLAMPVEGTVNEGSRSAAPSPVPLRSWKERGVGCGVC